jgi:hypothetical protein
MSRPTREEREGVEPVNLEMHSDEYLEIGRDIRELWDEALARHAAGDRSKLVLDIVVEGKLQRIGWYLGVS